MNIFMRNSKSNYYASIVVVLAVGGLLPRQSAAQENSKPWRSSNSTNASPQDVQKAEKEELINRFKRIQKSLAEKQQQLEQQLVEAKKNGEKNPELLSNVKVLEEQIAENSKQIKELAWNIDQETKQLAEMKSHDAPLTMDQLLAQ